MSCLKKYLIWIILLLAIGLRVYVYFTKSLPCTKPIEYSIGSVDDKFGISRTDFISIIINSEHIWEDSINKNLFEYSPKSDFKINLIYDSRQQISDKNKILTSNVDEKKQSADSIKNEISSLEDQYNQVKSEYAMLLDQYKQRKSDYNSLEQKRFELNNLVDDINTKVNEYNLLVRSTNLTISTINKNSNKEFEEGEYIYDKQGQRINIYEFSDVGVLTRLMAHELGHALGLDHNDNSNSIMYYLNNSRNMKPTVDDIQALRVVCGVK